MNMKDEKKKNLMNHHDYLNLTIIRINDANIDK